MYSNGWSVEFSISTGNAEFSRCAANLRPKYCVDMLRSSARKLHMSLSAVFKYQSLALGSETESMRRIPTKIVNTRVHNLYIREKEIETPCQDGKDKIPRGGQAAQCHRAHSNAYKTDQMLPEVQVPVH